MNIVRASLAEELGPFSIDSSPISRYKRALEGKFSMETGETGFSQMVEESGQGLSQVPLGQQESSPNANPPDIDLDKLRLFAQALHNQNTGLSLRDFLNNEVKKEVGSLFEAFTQNNFQKLHYGCHNLLSTCGALGLLKLSQLCRQIEEFCLDFLSEKQNSSGNKNTPLFYHQQKKTNENIQQHLDLVHEEWEKITEAVEKEFPRP